MKCDCTATLAVTTERECLDALREAAEKLGESPTKAQYERLDVTPSFSTIMRRIGGWNEAKDRVGLEKASSRGSRVMSKPDSVDLPDGTDWSELSADQRWHYRHVETTRKRTLDRRAANRAWLYEYRRVHCACERCDESDPACLESHHVDEDEKEMAVGTMVTYSYSRDRILREIDKCEVLCSNCHRKEQYEIPDKVDEVDVLNVSR